MPGRSTGELIVRTGLREKEGRAIVRSLQRSGLIEQAEDGWRLTAQAEREFGWALREIGEWLDGLVAEVA